MVFDLLATIGCVLHHTDAITSCECKKKIIHRTNVLAWVMQIYTHLTITHASAGGESVEGRKEIERVGTLSIRQADGMAIPSGERQAAPQRLHKFNLKNRKTMKKCFFVFVFRCIEIRITIKRIK